MAWNLDFISEEDFKKHVRATIMKYGEKLESYDLKRFNSNLIDPIKLIFDKSVYRTSWEEIVNNEIFRQRDKSNNNDIGYFHQNIFSYFKGCEVPQAGWDVIYRNPDGIQMPDGDIVHTIYVEMKNKHNTMNSASSAKTYIKMQGQILEDDDCACLLVEAIAKSLVDSPEEVVVTETEGRQGTVIELRVAPDDMGKVIGKQGRIAKALRTIVKAAAIRENKKVTVEIIKE